MPLFYQHVIDDDTVLGIWRIEEPESFFTEKVPVKREVSHPYKRLQHLAGRYLLQSLVPDFPLEQILVADTRKPYLADEKYHFSISHCGNHAAAIVSRRQRVGIDIELITPRIQQIRQKFLNDAELSFLHSFESLKPLHLQLASALWCAKESIYKWYGEGQVDFRGHIQLNGPVSFRSSEWLDLPFLFSKEHLVPLQVEARIFKQLVLAYVVT